MGRRLLLSLSVGAVLLGAMLVPSLASARVATLHAGDAKYYAKKTLRNKFHGAFVNGQGKRVRCGHRISRTKRRCQVRWGIGDLSYRGKVIVGFFPCSSGTCWDSRFHIRRINHYCLDTGGSRSKCTKHYRRGW